MNNAISEKDYINNALKVWNPTEDNKRYFSKKTVSQKEIKDFLKWRYALTGSFSNNNFDLIHDRLNPMNKEAFERGFVKAAIEYGINPLLAVKLAGQLGLQTGGSLPKQQMTPIPSMPHTNPAPLPTSLPKTGPAITPAQTNILPPDVNKRLGPLLKSMTNFQRTAGPNASLSDLLRTQSNQGNLELQKLFANLPQSETGNWNRSAHTAPTSFNGVPIAQILQQAQRGALGNQNIA